MGFEFEHGGPTATSQALTGAVAGLQSFINVKQLLDGMNREAVEFRRAGELFELQKTNAIAQTDATRALTTGRRAATARMGADAETGASERAAGNQLLMSEAKRLGINDEEVQLIGKMDPNLAADFLKSNAAQSRQVEKVGSMLKRIEQALMAGDLDQPGETPAQMPQPAGADLGAAAAPGGQEEPLGFSQEAAARAESLIQTAMDDPEKANLALNEIQKINFRMKAALERRGNSLQIMLGQLEDLGPEAQGIAGQAIKRAIADDTYDLEEVADAVARARFVDEHSAMAMRDRFPDPRFRALADETLDDGIAGRTTATDLAKQFRLLDQRQSELRIEEAAAKDAAEKSGVEDAKEAEADATEAATESIEVGFPEVSSKITIPGFARGQGRALSELTTDSKEDRAIGEFWHSIALQRWKNMKSEDRKKHGKNKEAQLVKIMQDSMRQHGDWK